MQLQAMRCGVYTVTKSTTNHRQCNSPVKAGEKGTEKMQLALKYLKKLLSAFVAGTDKKRHKEKF